MESENKGRKVKRQKEKEKEKIKENKKCINTFRSETNITIGVQFLHTTVSTDSGAVCYRRQLCTTTNSQNWTRKEMSHGVADNTESNTWPPHHDVHAAGNRYSRKNRIVFHLLLLFPSSLITYSSNYSSANPTTSADHFPLSIATKYPTTVAFHSHFQH
jgi:hypothetical protein